MPRIAYRPTQLDSGVATGNYQKGSGGFFGMHLPNLGGITAVKQLASGLFAIPEIISSFAPGGERAKGPELAAGVTKSVFDVLSTVGKVAGIPGTDISVGDKLIEPLGSAAVSGIGSMTGQDFSGEQWKPEDLAEQSRREGIIPALVNQVGTVAAVAAPIESALGASAKTAASAGDAARAAELAGKASLANKFAHPYTFAAEGIGDVARYAREVTTGGNEAAIAAGAEGTLASGRPGLDAAITAQRNVQTAAEEMVAPGGIDTMSLADELSNAAQANTDTTRLYRRGPDGMHFSTNPSTQAVADVPGVERLTTMDVPNSVLDEMRASGESAPHGQKGEQFDFSNRPEHTQSATERNANFSETARAKKVADEEAVTAAAEAQGIPPRESSEAAKYAERINAPTPAWARRIVDSLPDSVNRVISHLNTPMDRLALHNVKRDMERYVEVAQRSAQTSEAVQQANHAAETILAAVPGKSTDEVSRMIGEEVAARLDGTSMVDAHVKGGGDPTINEKLHEIARRNYQGIPPEVREALGPEGNAALDQALDQSVAAFKQERKRVFDTLLGSRKGSKGLEQQLLEDTDIPMTKGQLKKYRSVMQDQRRLRKLNTKALDEHAANEAKLADLGLGAEEMRREVVSAQEKVGIEMRTAASLKEGTPRMLASAERVQALVGRIIESVTSKGNSLIDVATGEHIGTSNGYAVGVAQQFDVELGDFTDNGAEYVQRAVTAPVDHTGAGYGVGIWNGADPKLAVQTYVDPVSGQQRVRGDIVIASLGGKELSGYQAQFIGEAFGTTSMRSLSDGTLHDLSPSPREQALSAVYLDQVQDPGSHLNRVGREMEAMAEGDTNLLPEDVPEAMRAQMMLDYSLHRSNPENELGDFFKNTTWDVGSRVPTKDALFQLVLRTTTEEALGKALNMDYETVNKALAWYYDSHDYIEKTYRLNADGTPKMVTLLDGTQREAAEVFYDLLAVTSVGASPTENLGRALSAMANMDDFLSGRQGSALNAQALMDHLDKMQPEMHRVLNVGTPEERILTGPGSEGTKLSSKFLTPEVRALTEGTQMFNGPKYNVMDVLSGRLRMDDMNNATLEANSEWWGQNRTLSTQKMPREDVVAWLDSQGIDTPEAKEYRDLVQKQNELKDANLAGREGAPLLQSMNEDTGSGDNQAQRITHEEAQQRLKRGKAILADKEAKATDTVNLTDESFIQKMYDATHTDSHTDSHGGEPDGQWGGGTLDTHTGEFVPIGEGAPDIYSITNRPTAGSKGKKPIAIDPTADYATFKKQWLTAVKTWGDRLRWEDAAFGVFNNPEAKGGHAIELDPVMMLRNEADTQAVGQASRAGGGAFHHPTKNGYWVDYTGDEYATGVTHASAKRDIEARLKMLETHSSIAPSLDTAAMEYHGSSALSKLRSFRSNLADPHNSLAVTMDSVMARMYGYDQTYWGGKGRVGTYSKQIRDAAASLTTRLGRDVKPHEVQALLWVWTKKEMYRQDWGRLLGAHDWAINELDRLEEGFKAGRQVDSSSFDPFGDWWEEDLAHSRGVHKHREEISYIKESAKRDGGRALTPDELAQIDEHTAELQRIGEHSEQNVNIQQDRPDVSAVPGMDQEGYVQGVEGEQRIGGIYTQGPKWTGKLESLQKYQDGPLVEIRAAMDAGDYDTARTLVTQYTNQQHAKMAATLEGGDFAEVADRSLSSTTKQANKDGSAMVENVTRRSTARLQHADKNLRPNTDVSQYEGMDALTQEMNPRGGIDQLNEMFDAQVRGATLEGFNKDGRIVGRLMQDGDLNTLVHESGHMLRRLLPENDLRFIESKYPGILGGEVGPTWRVTIEYGGQRSQLEVAAKNATEARLVAEQMTMATEFPGKIDHVQPRLKGIEKVAEAPLTEGRITAEESFVSDLMRYLHDRPRGAQEYRPFERLAATLEESYGSMVNNGLISESINPEIKAFWDNIFEPDIVKPDQINDPISLHYEAPPGGVETKRFRWETDNEYAKRTRQYGEARERAQVAKSQRRHAEQQVRKADAAVKRMEKLLENPTAVQKEAARLEQSIRTRLDSLSQALDNPGTNKVAAEWQPMWEGFRGLRDAVEEYPELADYLDEIPETFSAVLEYAADKGFEPTHIPDITAELAQKRLFGHLSLGKKGLDTEIESGTRKARTGALARAGLADRSVEALASGFADATHEVYTNELIHFVEDNFARPYQAGQLLPDGWVPWDTHRNAILTGTSVEKGGSIAVGTTQIIPANVGRALESMSNPYTHWTFHTLTKMTKPWRTLLLTLSPKWYVNNVFGNAILATAEGVKFKDVYKAYRDWKAADVPLDIPQAHSLLTQIDGGEHSLIHRRLTSDMSASPKLTAKGKVVLEHARHRLVRANESVDEIMRAAVYEKHLRTGASREFALTRASKAMVDYGDLSPIERGLVRSIVPFYAWQKGILKLVARFPVDHPLGTYALMQLGKIHEEMLSDKLNGPIPDAYAGYTQVGGKLRNLRSLNPFYDSTQLLSPEGITSSMFPFVDLLLRDAYNAPEQGTGVIEMGPTGAPQETPDYAAALKQNLLGFPQVRLGQSALGQTDVYGQDNSLPSALGQFLGNPRTADQGKVESIGGRTAESQLAQLLSPYYSADWAERIAQGWVQKHPNASPSEMEAYVRTVQAKRG